MNSTYNVHNLLISMTTGELTDFTVLHPFYSHICQLAEEPFTPDSPILLHNRVINNNLLHTPIIRHARAGNDLIRARYYNDTYPSTTILYPKIFLYNPEMHLKAIVSDISKQLFPDEEVVLTYTHLFLISANPKAPIGFGLEHFQGCSEASTTAMPYESNLTQPIDAKRITFQLGCNHSASEFKDPAYNQKILGVSRHIAFSLVTSSIYREFSRLDVNKPQNEGPMLNIFSPYAHEAPNIVSR